MIPQVSICCITYNHGNYIRECLEGFLMQKTSFPVEILIHDDASTDDTVKIIREYQERYPAIIKPIYRKDNIYSKVGAGGIMFFNLDRATGKYIALCEGDDFWTDPQKLQIQYDFMESNTDFSTCYHGRNNLNMLRKYYLPCTLPRENFLDGETLAHRIILNKGEFFTQTMFFRRESYEKCADQIKRDSVGAPLGDAQLAFHLALKGKVCYILRHMATYRIASGSAMCWENIHKPLNFESKFQQTMKNLAYNNGYGKWWQELQDIQQSWQLSNHISFEKYFSLKKMRIITSEFFFAIKKCIGRVYFEVYLRLSPEKRCRMHLFLK